MGRKKKRVYECARGHVRFACKRFGGGEEPVERCVAVSSCVMKINVPLPHWLLVLFDNSYIND